MPKHKQISVCKIKEKIEVPDASKNLKILNRSRKKRKGHTMYMYYFIQIVKEAYICIHR